MDYKLGEILTETLKAKQMSKLELSKRLHVSSTIISYWCNNSKQPTAENIQNICLALGVSADYLLGLENEDGTKNY